MMLVVSKKIPYLITEKQHVAFISCLDRKISILNEEFVFQGKQ